MTQTWTKRGAPLVVAASLLFAAACSSSSNSGGSSGASGAPVVASSSSSDPHEYTLGLLTDLTGPAASASRSTPAGVKAGVGYFNAHGFKIKYVVRDSGSSPTQVLQAAQALVTQDHVFAVLGISGLTQFAAKYLAQRGIPVVGAAIDGSEWITNKNMFSVFGYQDYTKVTTTLGDFLKLVGAKNLGAIGYSIVPSSALSAKASAVSAQVAGLKAGYVNAQFPFGSSNVAPIAIAMKEAGVDSLSASLEESTTFQLVNALHQQGVNLVAPVFSVGYGADLAEGGASASQIAQNSYFTLSYEPVEMQTAATKQFVNALKTYAGTNGVPTLNQYLGYVAVDAFVTGLQKTGSNPSQSQFINAMLGITHYTAAGLFGSHSIGFAMNQRGIAAGADNCIWMTQYKGTTFHLVKGATPICGQNTDKTVSAS
jgi:branched-chain amino acid transport system substrate-binding protein